MLDTDPPSVSVQSVAIASNQAASGVYQRLVIRLVAFGVAVLLWNLLLPRLGKLGQSFTDPRWDGYELPPLVMKGGDPYIRALMRTISASEASGSRPYSLLYGGQHVTDLSHHPDQCIPIAAGPNTGNCTTAAGRYQFITSTWLEQAKHYHPKPSGLLFWTSYSFEPEYQDEVVYRWLTDPDAWHEDLSMLLQNGQLDEVLYLLSPTWTSLGYGIESNTMTDSLPQIYQQALQEELRASKKN